MVQADTRPALNSHCCHVRIVRATPTPVPKRLAEQVLTRLVQMSASLHHCHSHMLHASYSMVRILWHEVLTNDSRPLVAQSPVGDLSDAGNHSTLAA